jgi:hypothetical protein
VSLVAFLPSYTANRYDVCCGGAGADRLLSREINSAKNMEFRTNILLANTIWPKLSRTQMGITMVDYLSKYTPGELIALVSVVGGLICGIVTIIAIYWYSCHKVDVDAKLKADMLDRGMSADDIKTVFEAGSTTTP